jgi:hypothetical protein
MSQDATTEVRRELALDVAGQSAALRIGVAQLREHRLRVLRDELVQHGGFGPAPSVAGERPAGRAGRSL